MSCDAFASLLVSGGMTLPMICKLLGHTQVQTTQRYAHLLDDPLRAGLEQVGDMLRAKPRLAENVNHSTQARLRVVGGANTLTIP